MRGLRNDHRLALRAFIPPSPVLPPPHRPPATLAARSSLLPPGHQCLVPLAPMFFPHQEQAYEASQKYKEGKYIVEKVQLFKARPQRIDCKPVGSERERKKPRRRKSPFLTIYIIPLHNTFTLGCSGGQVVTAALGNAIPPQQPRPGPRGKE